MKKTTDHRPLTTDPSPVARRSSLENGRNESRVTSHESRVRSPWSIVYGLLCAFILSFICSPASALDAYLNEATIGQFREDSAGVKEYPFNYYIGLGLGPERGSARFDANARVFYDFNKKTDNLDLYQAAISSPLKGNEKYQFTFGRQFISPGFSMFVMDGFETRIKTDTPLRLSVYSGFPRYPETEDFQKDSGLLAGGSLGVVDLGALTGGIDVLYHRRDLQNGDWNELDRLFLGTNWGADVKIFCPASVFFGGEFDVSGKTFELGTFGLDFYPHRVFSFNIVFNFIDANRGGTRDNLSALFSGGRGYQGQAGFTEEVIKHLELFQEYVYTYFKDPSGRNGSNHDVFGGVSYDIASIGMEITLTGHFLESYGGRAYGGNLDVEEDLFENWFVGAGSGFTRYSKVTNDNGNALSAVAWAGYELFSHVALSGNFEFNMNSDFERDIRGGLNLQYKFGRSTYPAHGRATGFNL